MLTSRYPSDRYVLSVEKQFLFGSALLISPVLHAVRTFLICGICDGYASFLKNEVTYRRNFTSFPSFFRVKLKCLHTFQEIHGMITKMVLLYLSMEHGLHCQRLWIPSISINEVAQSYRHNGMPLQLKKLGNFPSHCK